MTNGFQTRQRKLRDYRSWSKIEANQLAHVTKVIAEQGLNIDTIKS